jgi:hypothetical protein
MATEVQQRNYCVFIMKGQKAHRAMLDPHVSPALLDKLCAVHDEILEELRVSILAHSKGHPHGKA